jgi:cyanophycinase
MRISKFIICLVLFAFAHVLKAEPGVVVLAGGGPEGDIGVTTDWSYPLYKKLIENGDTTGDKKIKVVVLSFDKPDSNFMVDYLKSMGADSSHNLVISSKKEANDPKVTTMLKDADVIFIRGGNQGRAYQIWKDTKVHKQIMALSDRGGAIGGTSSGAMGLSQYSITGGKDFTTKEVLMDSHSPLLNDEIITASSGIHNDFLNMVPNTLVDTHCGERARVGRLLATMAKAVDDYKNKKIVSVCLEEKTGVAISKGKAKVFGTGLVHFMTETAETKKERIAGRPLSYTNVRDDALAEGWVYNLKEGSPDLKELPKNALALFPKINCSYINDHLNLKSSEVARLTFIEPAFSSGVVVAEDAYSDSLLITRDRKRGVMQTYSFNKLANSPNGSLILLDSSGKIFGKGKNNLGVSAMAPSIVLDCQYCSYKSKSSFVSNQDQGDQNLYSNALVNLRIHIIGAGDIYNVQTHKATLSRDILLYKNDCAKAFMALDSLDNFVSDQQNILGKLNCP